jgi:outer membrane immunogenic protein
MSWRFLCLIVSSFLIASVGSATAQEEKTVAARKWTGFYAGVNAGYTTSNNSVRTSTTNSFGNPALGGGTVFGQWSAALATAGPYPTSADGFIGGGQVGYNYLIAEKYLAGLEADFQGVAGGNNATNVPGQLTPTGFAGFPINQTLSVSAKLDYLGTVRGRVGYALGPNVLIYGTGGLAYGQVPSSTTITQAVANAPALPSSYSASGTSSNTLVGWTAGGGIEWWFASSWSAKAEYLYYDLGSVTYNLGQLQNFNNGGVPFTRGAPTAIADFNGSVIRAGLNFHF